MWIENLRCAYRSLRSTPAFTLTAIPSLGIGIGGSVAMFTLVNSIVLKPLAYPDSGKLGRSEVPVAMHEVFGGTHKQAPSLAAVALYLHEAAVHRRTRR
jgi:hypothetical protein